MVEELDEGSRSLQGNRHVGLRCEGPLGEGVGAMVKHTLGEVLGVNVGLDPEVAEHGVRFPTAKELDGILVNVGAEESSCSPRSETAGGEEEVVNTFEGREVRRAVAETPGNPLAFDVA